ncbi:cytochrome P450 [Aspergillus ambiguus]|uniref:cytochrome P450 n=1 Tax=Aspergillus ambiguus TaxID=176160 RepID=UPI003CCE4FDA
MYGLILAQSVLVITTAWLFLYHGFWYLRDPKKLRRFPGATRLAPFTNAWGALHQFRRTRTLTVHEAHRRHGPAVRVGPSHVSFATLEAIRDIYGHGTMALKDNFYGAFASTHLNVSDAQEKNVHNIKRKRFAIAFAQKSIVKLEPVVGNHLQRLFRILDANAGQEVDMKQLMMYLMYNIISVGMFSQDPQFLERDSTVLPAETLSGTKYQADIYKALCGSLHMSTTLGWIPRLIPTIKRLTSWHEEWKDGDRLRDITTHFVRTRLRMDTDRIRAGQEPLDDFMATLLWDRDRKEPLCLELGELLTEAQNMFNAAGGNTEIALTNIVWLLALHPEVVQKLRAELLQVCPVRPDSGVLPYDAIKDLPYLRACIDEGLRLRPSLPGGLPRIVPVGGMRVSGEWLDEGTTVSVSTYTMHRDPTVFHEEPGRYIPERWLQPGGNALQRGFLAFSQGGRGCLGRNIAYFQMQLVIASLFLRYDLTLPSADWELGIRETFSAHTMPLPVTVHPRKT